MTALAWVAPFVLAPIIGSFLGVLVLRLPERRGVVFGHSCCPACQHRLSAPDLVPVLSFLWRRGRCRWCAAPIDPFHLWIELAALAVPASAFWAATTPGLFWADCGLGWSLLGLGWTDLRSWVLPDALTLPLLLAGLGLAGAMAPARLGAHALGEHALGAALGWGGFALIGAAYRRLRGRDGLGGGDAKLLGAGGAWLGAAALPGVVLAAALGGLAVAAVQAARGRRLTAQTPMPLGPFLALAIWVFRLGLAGR